MTRKSHLRASTAMPEPPAYHRPPPTPLIAAVVRSGVNCPTFKNHMLSDEDRAYLQEHGMPNGSGYAIDMGPAPEGFTAVVPTE